MTTGDTTNELPAAADLEVIAWRDGYQTTPTDYRIRHVLMANVETSTYLPASGLDPQWLRSDSQLIVRIVPLFRTPTGWVLARVGLIVNGSYLPFQTVWFRAAGEDPTPTGVVHWEQMHRRYNPTTGRYGDEEPQAWHVTIRCAR